MEPPPTPQPPQPTQKTPEKLVDIATSSLAQSILSAPEMIVKLITDTTLKEMRNKIKAELRSEILEEISFKIPNLVLKFMNDPELVFKNYFEIFEGEDEEIMTMSSEIATRIDILIKLYKYENVEDGEEREDGEYSEDEYEY